MTTKASPKAKPSAHRQFEPGSRWPVGGGSLVYFGGPSPLAEIVARIQANPELGIQAAKDAGILTKTGRLKKTYRW
jgi:hypothetical protein